jgi:hypothetical protein
MRLHQFGLIQQTIAAFEARIIRATCYHLQDKYFYKASLCKQLHKQIYAYCTVQEWTSHSWAFSFRKIFCDWGSLHKYMCTIVAHSNYLLQFWFKENVCLNELTIGSSALFILTEGHTLSDAYPSFRAKGRINPPRQRSTCIQIPNCRASAAISYTPHPPLSCSS